MGNSVCVVRISASAASLTVAEVPSDWNLVIMASDTSVPCATARSWAWAASPEAARKIKTAMMISIGL